MMFFDIFEEKFWWNGDDFLSGNGFFGGVTPLIHEWRRCFLVTSSIAKRCGSCSNGRPLFGERHYMSSSQDLYFLVCHLLVSLFCFLSDDCIGCRIDYSLSWSKANNYKLNPTLSSPLFYLSPEDTLDRSWMFSPGDWCAKWLEIYHLLGINLLFWSLDLGS